MNHGRSYGIRRVRRRDKISADQWNAVAEAAVIRTNAGNYSGNSTGFHTYTRVGEGGGGHTVHFEIDEYDEYTGRFLAVLTSIPADGVVPGLEPDGRIALVDVDMCLLDEPPEELIRRRGHAHWQRVLDEYGGYTLAWVVGGLCCPPVEPLAE